jgi:hypothetical protein
VRELLRVLRAGAPKDRELNLRPPAVGLALPGRVTPDRLAFVVFMLASVTYDGLMVTPFWAGLRPARVGLGPVRHRQLPGEQRRRGGGLRLVLAGRADRRRACDSRLPLAHAIAPRSVRDPKLALMVLYTVLSLWIISRPIVE